MKGLPNTCHNYRTEGFQIPIKPFLFENLDLFGNPVVTPSASKSYSYRLIPLQFTDLEISLKYIPSQINDMASPMLCDVRLGNQSGLSNYQYSASD